MKRPLRAAMLSAALLLPSTLAVPVARPIPVSSNTPVQARALAPSEVQRLLDQGRVEEALAATQAALQNKPDSAKAHLLQARLLARSGKTEQAQAELTRAHALDPEVSLPTRSPQEIDRLIDQGQSALALGSLSDVLLTHPVDATAHYLAARAEAAQGHLEAARLALQEAERLSPGLPFANRETLTSLRRQLDLSSTSSWGSEGDLQAMVAFTGLLVQIVEALPWLLGGIAVISFGGVGLFSVWSSRQNRREQAAALADLEARVIHKSRAQDDQLVALRITALTRPEVQAQVLEKEEIVRQMFALVKRARAGEIHPTEAWRAVLRLEGGEVAPAPPVRTPSVLHRASLYTSQVSSGPSFQPQAALSTTASGDSFAQGAAFGYLLNETRPSEPDRRPNSETPISPAQSDASTSGLNSSAPSTWSDDNTSESGSSGGDSW